MEGCHGGDAGEGSAWSGAYRAGRLARPQTVVYLGIECPCILAYLLRKLPYGLISTVHAEHSLPK